MKNLETYLGGSEIKCQKPKLIKFSTNFRVKTCWLVSPKNTDAQFQINTSKLNTDDIQNRERQIPYDITYIKNLKYDTSEPMYETEIDSQTEKTNLWFPKGKGGEE